MRSDAVTPMMRQYYRFKEQYPGKILFFRMGDFYEMFGDDALEAAPILGIALTSRSVDKSSAVPLCGIPYHAVDKYLPRLIEAGKKVVICEQVEDPRKAIGIVKRDVVEIITPGTAVIDSSLSPTESSYLAALCPGSETIGLAFLDLSTGEFSVVEGDRADMLDQLLLHRPKELLLPDQTPQSKDSITELNGASWVTTPLEMIFFDMRLGQQNLERFFGVTTLDGFGVGDMPAGIASAGAILRYLQENKFDRLGHVTSIKAGRTGQRMLLDSATVRNLELFVNTSTGSEKHSLFWAMNRTGSAAGARHLRRSLGAPFCEVEKIAYRLDAVAELVENAPLSETLREHFRVLPDVERLSGRLGMGKATPRTLLALRDAIRITGKIRAIAGECRSAHLSQLYRAMPDLTFAAETIDRAICEDAPHAVNEGGLIRPGYSKDLDALNGSISDARRYIAGLATEEKKRTGIPTLKVGFNKVFGYYIEITRTHADKAPPEYIRKQTLVNAERYITEEMKQQESLILEAEEKINRLEEGIFRAVADDLAKHLPAFMVMSDLLAEADLVNALGILARDQGYIRPQIESSRVLEIIGARHPVLAQILGPGNFTPNDLHLDDQTEMIILTGPNMSGKSTWLRQAGLLVIMAQIGSFVPAETARIGLVDRVFTRVGATDNLTRGQSTFLVEMVETANILHNLSETSLVLLDEVGRGTSTFDGLSVAWAVAETIGRHPGGAPRTLFATHYHEMTGLSGIFPRIKNFQVAVKKWGGEIIFLHHVVPGGCDDSYGIEVARLAGLPMETIKRAREILRLLESGNFAKSDLARDVHVKLNQPSLFDSAPPVSSIEQKLQEVDLDQLTPLQALEFLAALKKDVAST